MHYDTEFLEQGSDHPIHLISMGLVSEGGNELYLINGEMPLEQIAKHEWLMQNVVPSLPLLVRTDQDLIDAFGLLEWDEEHPDYDKHVFNRMVIREKLTEYFDAIPKPELWGYCSAYDHVVLAQCFGTMTTMHHKLSYYTNDIAQLANQYSIHGSKIPAQTNTAHNALHDARWTRKAHEWIDAEVKALYDKGRELFGG